MDEDFKVIPMRPLRDVLRESDTLPLFQEIFSGSPAPVSPPLTGSELRDSGIESVLAHTPKDYRDRFVSVIRNYPRGHRFTVEDVRGLAGEPPYEVHPNCLGALMRNSAKQNLIELMSETRPSERSTRRHGRLAVWRRI